MGVWAEGSREAGGGAWGAARGIHLVLKAVT